MIVLDYRDRRPLYEQLVEQLQELILQDILRADEQLPSVRSLATDLSINPNTIQRAYAQLEREGLIYSVKGKGSFVAAGNELRKRRRTEILDKFRKVLREAMVCGVDRIELLDEINRFYTEGGTIE